MNFGGRRRIGRLLTTLRDLAWARPGRGPSWPTSCHARNGTPGIREHAGFAAPVLQHLGGRQWRGCRQTKSSVQRQGRRYPAGPALELHKFVSSDVEVERWDSGRCSGAEVVQVRAAGSAGSNIRVSLGAETQRSKGVPRLRLPSRTLCT